MTHFERPYDPNCNRWASEMTELDWYIKDAGSATEEEREQYIIREEVTYNHDNGHFLCDDCYSTIGMRPNGWVCP